MEAAEVNPKEIAQKLIMADVVRWAVVNKIKVIGGVFSLKDHEYQATPMRSTARRKCYMKATKGGWTEMEVLDTLHGMMYGYYPAGVLHAFPTNDTVSDFSKGRFRPLISKNPCIASYVRETNAVNVKQVGDAFLYLRGARLSDVIDSTTKESSKLKDIIVDKFVADECDHMSEATFEKLRGRLQHSKVRKEVYVSNPVMPDSGIHALYKKSDQRQWFRHCSSCGTWTCAEREFPDCVKIRRNGTSYIACKKCGKPVALSPGEWVAAYRDKAVYMEGYQLSHLSSTFVEPREVLEAFEDPPEGNLSDVYRLRLGLPHVAVEDRLTQAQVLTCCGSNLMSTGFGGPAAMGVDVGNVLHVVIGYNLNRRQKEVIKVVRVSDWDDLHDLARKYGVQSAVVDLKPEGHSARKFKQEAKFRVFLCDYSDYMKTSAKWNQETGIVSINRTDICDRSHRAVTDEAELVLPRRNAEMGVFAAQMANIAKSLEDDTRTGTRKYRYRTLSAGKPGTSDDHYRHAVNYFLMACDKVGVVESGPGKKLVTQQYSEYYI